MLPLVLLLGCTGKPVAPADSAGGTTPVPADDTGTDTRPTDSGTDGPCVATVVGILPADTTTSVLPDTAIVATFDAPTDHVDVALAPTAAGSSRLADDKRSVTWTPSEPLARGTRYTVSVAACAGSASAAFTTIPPPLADAEALEWRTWDMDLTGDDATWTRPALGPELAGSFRDHHLLVTTQFVDARNIDVVAAWGVGEGLALAQSTCAEPLDFVGADFVDTDPAFVVGPVDTALVVDGLALPLLGLDLFGVLTDDGATLVDATLTGFLDLAPLAPMLGGDPCALAEAFGDTCEACPDGGSACLPLEVRVAAAPELVGVVVDPDLDLDCEG